MADDDDEDWLLARERGDDVSHVDPRTRARYEQLEQLLGALPERPPPAGWRQRALDALDAPSPRSSSDALESPPAPAAGRRKPIVHGWRAWLLAGGGAAVGILVLQLIIHVRMTPPPAEPVVTTETRRGESRHRGGDVAVGDTLVIHAQSDQPIELRVYGEGGEPLARCTDAAGCTVERNGAQRRYTLEVPMRSPGDVSAVMFSGGAIPAAGKDLEADLEAAHAAPVDARQVASVHVR
jgi:hypothetical protein